METMILTAIDTKDPDNRGSIHKVELVYKDAWAPGYGDTSQPTKEPWAICTCGFETNLFGNHDHRFELVRINHLLIAIAKEVGVIIA
ncbi:MAG TPA: hypothetical protein PKC05_01380 [Candidatus Saccharibacteria bacterium]|nr:hypothetical protein [Candidatus Saccharibacteria bacterium]